MLSDDNKMNRIFGDSLSGIINEGKRKSTMPAFLEKLAEDEEKVKEDGEEWIDEEGLSDESISYDENIGLSRATELSNDESRIVESKKVESIDYKKKIEKEVEALLSSGYSPKEIEKALVRKFPRSQVKKFFEANSIELLKKYGQFGIKFFEKLSYKESKNIEDSIRNHKSRLKEERAMAVLSSFYDYLKKLKNQKQRTDSENRVSFKRDVDQKEMKERTFDINNKKRNAKIEEEKTLDKMLIDFKASIQSGLSKKESHQKLLKAHKPTIIEKFYTKYSEKIKSYIKFSQHERFETDFNKIAPKAKVKNVEEFENRKSTKDDKKMLNYAFDLMTNGKSIREINRGLKKKFGFNNVVGFLQDNMSKLSKHYGQLGYIFIDSNIYSNCDEMKKSFANISHNGNNLIYAVKASKECRECTSNAHGKCKKVDLLISNHPIVRSSRAARKVLKRALKFLPKDYVNEFEKRISNDNNMKLISEFSLGMEEALRKESKNIGKTASLEKDSLRTQESFEKVETYGTDLFNDSVDSKIINDIILND